MSFTPLTPGAPQEDPVREMSFFEHLDEMRQRLIRCAMVFMVGFVVSYFFAEVFLDVLRQPLFKVLPIGDQKLYFTHVFESFLIHLKISAVASLFFLSPYFFYQLWAFISPGLYYKEKRWGLMFSLGASAFFIGGALFAYYGVFPLGFKFFIEFGGPSNVPLITMSDYYHLCLRLFLVFGLAFEFPVLVALMLITRMVTLEQLKLCRRGVIIGIACFSALFAPPDALSMILLGVPLYVLYEGVILVFSGWQSPAKAEPHPLEGRSRP